MIGKKEKIFPPIIYKKEIKVRSYITYIKTNLTIYESFKATNATKTLN